MEGGVWVCRIWGFVSEAAILEWEQRFWWEGGVRKGYRGKNCSLWAGEGYLEEFCEGFVSVGRDLCGLICHEGWLDCGAHCQYEKVLNRKVFVKNFRGSSGKLAKPRFTGDTFWKHELSVKPRPKKANADLDNIFFYSQKNN